MSARANKKLMQDIFAASARSGRARPSPVRRSLAEDARWVVTGQYSWSHDLHGARRRSSTICTAMCAPVLRASGRGPWRQRFIADGDIVVVEAKGDNVTPEGVRYDNDYCLVFRLEDGKIKEIREYCNSTLTEKRARPVSARAVRAAS